MNYTELDPGIRSIVEMLNNHGFVTTDSGDGVSKPADERTIDDPHVICQTTVATMIKDAHRLQDLLGDAWHIEASYDPSNCSAILLAVNFGLDWRTRVTFGPI